MGAADTGQLDAVWDFVGRNPDSGCDPPASSLTKNSLLRGLLAVAARESDERGEGLRPGRIRRMLSHHWIEFGVIAFLVLVVAGVARIKLMQAHWPTLPGLVPITIAAVDLDSSRTISADDLTTVYLPPRARGTADAARIVGRRVPRAIDAGKQIDVTELHAPQLMARSAIAAGQKVDSAAVRIGWAVEQRTSLRSPADAIGRCLVTSVDAGTVIRRDDLSTCP